MNNEKTSSEKGETDIADVTDNSLITDFTQVVSCMVGKNRAERRREKIREEIVRQYIDTGQSETSSLKSSIKKIFKLD